MMNKILSGWRFVNLFASFVCFFVMIIVWFENLWYGWFIFDFVLGLGNLYCWWYGTKKYKKESKNRTVER